MIWLLIVPLIVAWLALDYLQARLLVGRKVKELYGAPLSFRSALSLVTLYCLHPQAGSWRQSENEFEKWLDDMEIELSEEEAKEIARRYARITRGKYKLKMRALLEQVDLGKTNPFDAAKECAQVLRKQVRLGHDVMYSLFVGAVYCLIPVAVAGLFLYKALFNK